MVFSLDRWANKVAVVTGASSGIGAAIAERLVEEGLIVVGLARRSNRVKQLSKKLAGKKGKLHALKTDISKEKDLIKAFKWITEKVGPVSILINNAGVIKDTTLLDGDTAKWKATFDTNVIGLCIATREASKIMRANNIDGYIIHISSMAGHRIPPLPGVNVYPSSKFAVTALTETLRQELNQIGSKIRITTISPGAVDTEVLQNNNFKSGPIVDYLNETPTLKSEDLADSVVYVLSTPPHVQIHEMLMLPV